MRGPPVGLARGIGVIALRFSRKPKRTDFNVAVFIWMRCHLSPVSTWPRGLLIIVARLLLISIVDITQPMRAPPVGLARGIGVIAFRLLPEETKTVRLQRGGFYMDALPSLARLEVALGPF